MIKTKMMKTTSSIINSLNCYSQSNEATFRGFAVITVDTDVDVDEKWIPLCPRTPGTTPIKNAMNRINFT